MSFYKIYYFVTSISHGKIVQIHRFLVYTYFIGKLKDFNTIQSLFLSYKIFFNMAVFLKQGIE